MYFQQKIDGVKYSRRFYVLSTTLSPGSDGCLQLSCRLAIIAATMVALPAGELMRIHILGICGTFMGSLALLARALGHSVEGSDSAVYPPMSTQLAAAGIRLCEGYRVEHLQPHPDLVIIGNAMSRGNAAVEYVLDQGLDYISGPAWLEQAVLRGRHVIAIAGTHGKTTTTSMVAWILDRAGLAPGYLIGGVPLGFAASASLGQGRHFVVEADEYDTAFFDKRSKFVHYRPRTLLINNIEYDHADIFPDLAAIETQFHHLMRIVPSSGLVLHPGADATVDAVLARGSWSRRQSLGSTSAQDWSIGAVAADGSHFEVCHQGRSLGTLQSPLSGAHNRMNALAALAVAVDAGVAVDVALTALASFPGVKRRLELLGTPQGIAVYDDFAHHPTAIHATLQGLRQKVGADKRIIAVIEPRSNTMRMGVHQDSLLAAVEQADHIFWYQPESLAWDLSAHLGQGQRSEVVTTVDDLIERLQAMLHSGDQVLIMSNGGFAGLHQRLLQRLSQAK